VFFKERDESGQWRGQWNDDNKPVIVLKEFNTTIDLVIDPSPKLKVEDLDKVKLHWEAILDIMKPGSEQVEVEADITEGGLLDRMDSSDDDYEASKTTFTEQVGIELRKKWAESNGWWQELFKSENAYWSAKPEGTKSAAYPAIKEEDLPFLTLPCQMEPRGGKKIEEGEAIMHVLDNMVNYTNNFPPALIGLVSRLCIEAIEKEKELVARRPPEGDTTLYLHSSESSTKPPSNTAYCPTLDLEVGHAAIVKVETDQSSGGRGWDVVEVQSTPVNGVFRAVYLMPAGCKLKYNTQPPYPAWPDNWMTKKLQPVTVGKFQWIGDVDVDSVQFSVQLTTKGKTVPKKFWESLRCACVSIETQRTVQPLESDGEMEAEDES